MVEQGPPAIGDQEVEREGQGATAFGPGARGDARGGVGLVIRRRADLEGALEHLEHAPAPLVGARLGEALAPGRLGEPGHALGQLEGGDVLVRRVGEEGMQARVEPHHHADGPRADLSGDGQPFAPRLADVGEGASPEPGVLVDLQEQHRERPAGDLDHAPQHGPVARVKKVGVALEHASAGVLEPARDAGQLGLAGAAARRRTPVGGLVLVGARGREAEGAGGDGLGGHPAHLVDLGGGGHRRVVGAALAHHEDAQGAVGHLRAHVDGARDGGEGVEVLGEGLPGEVEAGGEHGLGDVLDPFHQVDEQALSAAPHRGEADPAVAHDDRGDAVPRRRRHLGIPQGLAVVVGVDVHPARHHVEAARVDLAPAALLDRTHRGDPRAVEGHVAGEARAPRAVDHRPAPNHGVVHGLASRRPTDAVTHRR